MVLRCIFVPVCFCQLTVVFKCSCWTSTSFPAIDETFSSDSLWVSWLRFESTLDISESTHLTSVMQISCVFVQARLMSYRENGFLMGCSTSRSGLGVVGGVHAGRGCMILYPDVTTLFKISIYLVGHAYSLLDVREISDAVVGEQPSIKSFFAPKGVAARQTCASDPKLQPEARSWTCGTCTYRNPSNQTRSCSMCNLPFKDEGNPKLPIKRAISEVEAFATHWTCERCTFRHEGKEVTRKICTMCGTRRKVAGQIGEGHCTRPGAKATRLAERRAHVAASGLTSMGTLRMLRIRNPWGKLKCMQTHPRHACH